MVEKKAVPDFLFSLMQFKTQECGFQRFTVPDFVVCKQKNRESVPLVRFPILFLLIKRLIECGGGPIYQRSEAEEKSGRQFGMKFRDAAKILSIRDIFVALFSLEV